MNQNMQREGLKMKKRGVPVPADFDTLIVSNDGKKISVVVGNKTERTEHILIDERALRTMTLNLQFVRYLMASFLYYDLDEETPYSDETYDQLCKHLHENWDKITHPHKRLTTKEDLKAGTGMMIRRPIIPLMLIHASLKWSESTIQNYGRITW